MSAQVDLIKSALELASQYKEYAKRVNNLYHEMGIGASDAENIALASLDSFPNLKNAYEAISTTGDECIHVTLITGETLPIADDIYEAVITHYSRDK